MATAGPDGGEPFAGGEDGPADATVLRMLLGAQLRRFREAVGVTPEATGYEIRASPSKISRMEKGKVKLKTRGVADLLTRYGVTDETVRVTIQAIPFASGIHAAESGSFTVLRFAERDLPDVVYAEQLTGALYLDQRQDVERYLQVASELSSQALTPAATIRFIEQATRDL